MTFYQQLLLYSDRKADFKAFLLERPLWIFVGGSVNAVRSENKKEVSDVVDILLFLSEFLKNKKESVGFINLLIKGKAGILDKKGNEVFGNVFTYLIKQGKTAEEIYSDILRVIFNTSTTAGLHIENLKGVEGEIGLRIGDGEYFGVINVSDDSKLCKLCQKHKELIVDPDREFKDSLFRNLNETDSKVNILIGSKKFTEGWNSWRVATMGLMNIGKTEGAQIIQLFGRGVRLKGLEFSLKRSNRIEFARETHEPIRTPEYIEHLETLNIFGIRADYMRQFKDYLEDEGLPSDKEWIEFIMPVVNLKGFEKKKLKTIKLKEGINFKKTAPKPILASPDEKLRRNMIVLDWYPKIQALASDRAKSIDIALKEEAEFTKKHIAFLDFDSIYSELHNHKNEKSWYNLNLTRRNIKSLLMNNGWYKLLIPKSELDLRNFNNVRRWQNIAVALIKKYGDKFYKHKKAEYENKHLEYQELKPDDPNFFEEYHLLIEQSKKELITTLEGIKDAIKTGELRDVDRLEFTVFQFNQHLYKPLIY
ncbi:MAG: restriction endonuclease subunit R, partial [Candidatus Heimdallarchaeota archaeon]|nr:restriction endonuclease subunit R [Candidatus Heimdallarchaeota archaeon]